MWGILVALISGALMSLQGVFNTEVTKQSSIWAAAGWVQATALITCVVLYFCTGRGEIWGMFSIDRKYMLLGGGPGLSGESFWEPLLPLPGSLCSAGKGREKVFKNRLVFGRWFG